MRTPMSCLLVLWSVAVALSQGSLHAHTHTHGCPALLPLAGKQCRERYQNHLAPDLNRGPFTEEEDETLMRAVRDIGTRWIEIARRLPGRSENACKNRYNSTLRRQANALKAVMRKKTPSHDLSKVAVSLAKQSLGVADGPGSSSVGGGPEGAYHSGNLSSSLNSSSSSGGGGGGGEHSASKSSSYHHYHSGSSAAEAAAARATISLLVSSGALDCTPVRGAASSSRPSARSSRATRTSAVSTIAASSGGGGGGAPVGRRGGRSSRGGAGTTAGATAHTDTSTGEDNSHSATSTGRRQSSRRSSRGSATATLLVPMFDDEDDDDVDVLGSDNDNDEEMGDSTGHGEEEDGELEEDGDDVMAGHSELSGIDTPNSGGGRGGQSLTPSLGLFMHTPMGFPQGSTLSAIQTLLAPGNGGVFSPSLRPMTDLMATSAPNSAAAAAWEPEVDTNSRDSLPLSTKKLSGNKRRRALPLAGSGVDSSFAAVVSPASALRPSVASASRLLASVSPTGLLDHDDGGSSSKGGPSTGSSGVFGSARRTAYATPLGNHPHHPHGSHGDMHLSPHLSLSASSPAKRARFASTLNGGGGGTSGMLGSAARSTAFHFTSDGQVVEEAGTPHSASASASGGEAPPSPHGGPSYSLLLGGTDHLDGENDSPAASSIHRSTSLGTPALRPVAAEALTGLRCRRAESICSSLSLSEMPPNAASVGEEGVHTHTMGSADAFTEKPQLAVAATSATSAASELISAEALLSMFQAGDDNNSDTATARDVAETSST